MIFGGEKAPVGIDSTVDGKYYLLNMAAARYRGIYQ